MVTFEIEPEPSSFRSPLDVLSSFIYSFIHLFTELCTNYPIYVMIINWRRLPAFGECVKEKSINHTGG
ncbi:hypothetical protein T12_16698 [Trichinella patagoniensis]|uniref:Uncharacterized protein n=1 Tax=Trichinella patagoniensis TaxID=990121 RepID=A0A0V0ZJC2_9BILA|nr:hypothetical protein T12_16698 [Trichinella patagoniensis]